MIIFDSLIKKVLNKSNSYIFYKNSYNNINKKYKKLMKRNKHLKNKTIDLEKENYRFSTDIDRLNHEINLLKSKKNDLLLYANNINHELLLYAKESLYSNIFRDTISESTWLINKKFSLHYGAANYSFLYVLYRILDELRPINILEFGLGQTTKLTTEYINNTEYGKSLTVIDDDQEWIENFSKKLNINDSISINKVDIEEFTFDSSINRRYALKDLRKHLGGGVNKFDLIIIDGPVGFNQSYPRSNILDIVDNLDDEFIIIMDDHERDGERNITQNLLKIFEEKGIKYHQLMLFGIKEQLVIGTEKYKSLAWF